MIERKLMIPIEINEIPVGFGATYHIKQQSSIRVVEVVFAQSFAYDARVSSAAAWDTLYSRSRSKVAARAIACGKFVAFASSGPMPPSAP